MAVALRRLAPLLVAVCAERHRAAHQVLDREAAAASLGPRRRLVFSFAAAALAGAATAIGEEVEASKTALQERFERFDMDGDGATDRGEYLAVAQAAVDAEGAEEATKRRVMDFYERLFEAADIDGDGRLSEREFDYGELLHTFSVKEHQARGADRDVVPEDEFLLGSAAEVLTDHDANSDGVIDRAEFDAAMLQTIARWGMGRFGDDPEVRDWLDELFARADVTGDGIMSVKEVQYTAFAADEAFRHGQFFVKRWAGMCLEDFDANGDGKISKEELPKDAEEGAEGGAERGGKTSGRMLLNSFRKQFAVADADGDGSLDVQEVAKFAAALLGEL